MDLIGILVLGALVAVSALSGGPGFFIAAALGLLAWWCLKLQRRIALLEADRTQTTAPATQATQSIQIDEPIAARPVTRTPTPRVDPADLAEPPIAAARADAVFAESIERPSADAHFARTQSPLDKILAHCKSWISTGNVPVKVGVILSVFGLAFLVKEAIDRSWLVLPIEYRLLGVAAFGIALLVIGWRLRNARAGYGLSLQGGGIAVVYLTVFAAYGIYSLIPAVPAFALLVITTIAAGCLAVMQNARALAVLGIIGGFMAPILASSGSGNHVILFSYYAILNCAIIGIAWQRAWRELNVLGFVFTFVIGSIWGYTGYNSSEFSTTEPFLILFFFIYVFIPVFFARSVAPNIRGFVDGTLVFGAPLVAFGLQATLVSDTQYGLAWTAGGLTVFYSALAAALLLRAPDYMRVLGEAFAGLAFAFLAITFPLYFDAPATSLAWAIQGTAMCWLGWRQNRPIPLMAGVALQGLAAGAWFASHNFSIGRTAVLNGPYLGAVTLAVAAALSSRIFDFVSERRTTPIVRLAAGGLLAWSALWWFGAGFAEIDRTLPWEHEINAYLAFAAGTVALATFITRTTTWTRPTIFGLALIPTLGFGALLVSDGGQPLGNYGWLAWIAVFASHLFFLKSCEDDAPQLSRILHPLGLITLVGVCMAEIYWHAERSLPGVWPESLILIVTGAVLVMVARFADRLGWPITAQPAAYKLHGAGIIAAAAAIFTLVLNIFSDGSAGSLAYVPIFNPLELASIGFAVCLVIYLRALRELDETIDVIDRALQFARPAIAVLSWALLTMICARSVHHYAGVPFDFDRLMSSDVFQATLSILWGGLAFGGMIYGARRSDRFVWMAGGGLMTAVVVKLFLIDLANTATVERVISFLGVGLLLLVVGYFAPVPPRAAAATTSQPG